MKSSFIKFILPCSLIFSSTIGNYNMQKNQNYFSKYKLSATSERKSKELANDNDFSTYWESEEKSNQFLEIDLGEIQYIEKITQIFKDEDVWYFTIEGSIDKNDYFELVNHKNGQFGYAFEESADAYARYIRLNIIKSKNGFSPSSKEFFVSSKNLKDGENIAKGIKANSSTNSFNYEAKNAFDGNSGTYWCAKDGSYPQELNGIFLDKSFAKDIEITFNDFGIYEFELNYVDGQGNLKNICPNERRNGSKFYFDINDYIKEIKYNVYGGPGWANVIEMKINGFSKINYQVSSNIISFDYLTYIYPTEEIIKSNLMYSLDNKTYVLATKSDLENGFVCKYIKIDKQIEILGTNLSKNLIEDLDGKCSDFDGINHSLSNITSENVDNKNTYKSSFKGRNEEIIFDIGRDSLINGFELDIPNNINESFEIKTSLDGVFFEKYWSSAGFLEKNNTKYHAESYIKTRYIKVEISPSNEHYAEISKLKIYGQGNRIIENWRESNSGVLRFYPKLQEVTLNQITSQLDEIVSSGFKVIELHQPYEGLADIWAGLGGTNNYQVDPIIGNLDDLALLLDEAHKRDLYVFMFGNVGYGKNTADYFKKACKDYALGINSRERNWFVFSDVCLDPSKWFYSDIAKAYYYGYWGENGQIPTFNFANEEWQNETNNYISYWSNFGFDGIALDAPDVYYYGGKNISEITFNNITKILLKNNMFSIPEGTGDTRFISGYNYKCIQNYGLSNWGGGAFSVGLNNAKTHSVNKTDDVIKNGRDPAVSYNGIALGTMNFEDNYLNEKGNSRVLEAALVTSSGHFSFLHSGSAARIGQDIMKTWDESIQNKIHTLFGLQNSLYGLNPTGHRYKTLCSSSNSIYSFIKTDMSNKSIILPIFNYSLSDIDAQIFIGNTDINLKDGKYLLYDAFNDENVEIEVSNGSFKVLMKKESYRCLMVR